MSTVAPVPAARLEIASPRLLTTPALALLSVYGLLLMLPVLLALLAVSVIKYGLLTYLIPLGTMAAATYFLPFGFGNPYITRLVRSLRPVPPPESGGMIVQLTLEPSLRAGLRSMFEDADDIGWLSITDTALVFQGDSVQLTVPRAQIQQVQRRSIGWRGFFLYGARVRLQISGMPEVTALEFAERSSRTLPDSRRMARQLYARLAGA